MQAFSTTSRPHRGRFGRELVFFVAMVVAVAPASAAVAIDGSANGLSIARPTPYIVDYARTNHLLTTFDASQFVSGCQRLESGWFYPGTVERVRDGESSCDTRTASSARPNAATRNSFQRMKFLESNELPGDDVLIPPPMELNGGRQ